MKITVEFLSLPNVVKIVGARSLTIDLAGRTPEDLVNQIVNTYGRQLGKFLLDESGRLDLAFRVMLNRQEWIAREQMSTALQDGDRVTIMLLVGGG